MLPALRYRLNRREPAASFFPPPFPSKNSDSIFFIAREKHHFMDVPYLFFFPSSPSTFFFYSKTFFYNFFYLSFGWKSIYCSLSLLTCLRFINLQVNFFFLLFSDLFVNYAERRLVYYFFYFSLPMFSAWIILFGFIFEFFPLYRRFFFWCLFFVIIS